MTTLRISVTDLEIPHLLQSIQQKFEHINKTNEELKSLFNSVIIQQDKLKDYAEFVTKNHQ